jgi:hypothetical protein
MRPRLVVSVGLACIALGVGIPRCLLGSGSDPKRPTLPVDADSPAVFVARFELEMRRAGGPRRDVTMNLLRLGARVQAPEWAFLAVRACEQGVADCRELAEEALAVLSRAGAAQKQYLTSAVSHLEAEAAIAAVARSERQAVYRAVLLGHGPGRIAEVSVSTWSEAAVRALREHFDDLLPEIERTIGDHPADERGYIGELLAVRKAATSAEPAQALLALVRRGIDDDLQRLLASVPGGSATSTDEFSLRCAHLALVELRESNMAGTITQLRQLLALYASAEVQAFRERNELEGKLKDQGRSIAPGDLPSPHRARGYLAVDLLETIGDLGDRGFERSEFRKRLEGTPPLWDRVNAVESELVRQGKMKASEMVTSEQQ